MVESPADHPDLGADLHRLGREVLRRERPLLAALGVDLWDYMVMSRLQDGPAPTQGQLAAAVGRDATRLIATLDGLQARGLLERTPDPRDRRNRVVALTAAGRTLLAACRTAIRAMEADLLGAVPAGDRQVFRDALTRLAADLPP